MEMVFCSVSKSQSFTIPLEAPAARLCVDRESESKHVIANSVELSWLSAPSKVVTKPYSLSRIKCDEDDDSYSRAERVVPLTAGLDLHVES